MNTMCIQFVHKILTSAKNFLGFACFSTNIRNITYHHRHLIYDNTEITFLKTILRVYYSGLYTYDLPEHAC